MTWYYEYSIGALDSRASFVLESDLINIIVEFGQGTPIYKSVFLYPEDSVQALIELGSVKNFYGKRFANWIPIDIDRGKKSDAEVFKDCYNAVNILLNAGLDEYNFIVWHSGTGYHIDIHSGCFGLEPSEQYPFLIKEAIASLGINHDPMIYTRSAMIRAPYSCNLKSGRYKIHVDLQDILNGEMEKIINEASDYKSAFENLKNLDLSQHTGNGELKHLIKDQDRAKAERYNKRREATVEDRANMTAACINAIWNVGPMKGARHASVMRLAAHFCRSGIPISACKASLIEWIEDGIEEKELFRLIENTYSQGYKYSCGDEILKQHCKPNCIYYKDRNYNPDAASSGDVFNRLVEFYDKTASEKVDFGVLFGLDKHIYVYPGELVLLMGPTGCNKTTVAQCLAMGFEMSSCVVNKKYQRDTSIWSLELADTEMYIRSLMIASGYDREYVVANLESVHKVYGHYCEHIKYYTSAPTLVEFEAAIRRDKSKFIIIDYMDTFMIGIEGKDEGANKMKRVMHQLSNICVRYKIIILMISQVKRDHAAAGTLGVYSGVGSGALENASRKVFIIDGKQTDDKRTIWLDKDNFGQTMPKTTFYVNDSYRLTRQRCFISE